jgi:hypothetical protein
LGQLQRPYPDAVVLSGPMAERYIPSPQAEVGGIEVRGQESLLGQPDRSLDDLSQVREVELTISPEFHFSLDGMPWHRANVPIQAKTQPGETGGAFGTVGRGTARRP